MYRTRSRREIKFDVRMMIKSNSKIIIHSLAYIVLSYLLSVLYSRLSGYTELMNSYMAAIQSGGDIFSIRLPTIKPTAQLLAGLIYFMSIILADGYRGYCLLQARHLNPRMSDIFPRIGNMVKIICIDLLSGVLVGLASIFLVVPGIILLYSYRMAIYIMYDHPEYTIVQCLRESRHMMKGNKWELFVLDLSFIGWYIASGIVAAAIAPILDMWIEPYAGITVATFYNERSTGGTYGMDFNVDVTDEE